MKTKRCPNCQANVAAFNEKCPLCGFDLTKDFETYAELHQEKLKQTLKPSDKQDK
ncbi:MAG: hypothetical protein NC299_05535 [Lachnospiraceae bacterium]|nr:hypothetical protein [Ruminococcus sp.]MCM1274812.1 hypothetical protein [Lachnospiraceae bacterium]